MIKALATCVGYFAVYTLGGLMIAGVIGLPLLYLAAWLAGLEEGGATYTVAAQVILVAALISAWGAALEESIRAVKERPRGLGIRRGRGGWERF